MVLAATVPDPAPTVPERVDTRTAAVGVATERRLIRLT
jgi:hypothetical protein